MTPAATKNAAALPLVIWAIAFLSFIVIMLASRMNEQIDEETLASKSLRARQLALSGIAFGLHPDIKPGHPFLKSGSSDEGFSVEILNESGRINPNLISQPHYRELLRTLLSSWDIPLDRADAAIDSLLDWIDPDSLRQLAGAEAPEYSATGLDGLPANAPLNSTREMSAILNLREILAQHEGWSNYFTVWHTDKINIIHASPQILADVGRLSEIEIANLTSYRQGPDGLQGTDDDGPIQSIDDALAIAGISGDRANAIRQFFDVKGNIRRIESSGTCHGLTHKITVISPENGEILSWEEN